VGRANRSLCFLSAVFSNGIYIYIYMSVGFGSLEISSKMLSFFCYVMVYHVRSFLARSYDCETKFILPNDLFRKELPCGYNKGEAKVPIHVCVVH
jgi:hypothetical protein